MKIRLKSNKKPSATFKKNKFSNHKELLVRKKKENRDQLTNKTRLTVSNCQLGTLKDKKKGRKDYKKV